MHLMVGLFGEARSLGFYKIGRFLDRLKKRTVLLQGLVVFEDELDQTRPVNEMSP